MRDLLRYFPPREQWLVFTGYLLLAVVITFPSLLTLSTHVMGGTTGDNYEMLRHVWWYTYALRNGEPLYYQTLLGYPDGFSSMVFASVPLQYLPMAGLAFFLPLPLAYNVVVLLTLAMNGWATYWLARALLGRENDVPALLAGAVFASAPLLQGHLFDGHAGLLVMYPSLLYLWALWGLVHAQARVWAWGLAVFVLFNLVPSGHVLQSLYVLTPVTGAFFLWRIARKDARGVRRMLVACGLAGAFLVLTLLPIVSETLATRAYTSAGGVVRYSADLLSIVSPSPFHPFWGFLGYPAQVLGVNLGEGIGYLGVFVAPLVALGLWRKREARWLGWLALVAWVLSLGSLLKVLDRPLVLTLGDYQTHVPLLWAWVQDVAGFNLARTPARFNFTVALAVALLAGYGASVLWEWGKRWGISQAGAVGLMGLLVAGIVWDVQVFFPMPTRDTSLPAVLFSLRERDDVRAVFDVPHAHLLAAKDALFYQTAHQKPLIGGQITRQTPVNPAKLSLLEATLDPALLREYGADVVFFHKARAKEMQAYDSLQAALSAWGAPLYEDSTLAIYDVPQARTVRETVASLAPSGAYEAVYSMDVYVPQRRWLDLNAVIEADRRTVALWIDGARYRTWHVDGRQMLDVPLPFDRRGFYRVELRLEPPCIPNRDVTLTCKSLNVRSAQLRDADSQVLKPFIAYANGVTLVSASVRPQEDMLEVRLWWQLTQELPKQSVRFVHVLDASGRNVRQSDDFIGESVRANVSSGASDWVETVRLPLEGLEAGDYSVRVGWYTYPDLVRFAVQDTRLVGARDNAPQVLRFTRQ